MSIHRLRSRSTASLNHPACNAADFWRGSGDYPSSPLLAEALRGLAGEYPYSGSASS